MVWNGSCIRYAQSVQIHPIIKAKTRKTRRKTKRHEENGKTPNGTGHARSCVAGARPCASHHGPWWAPRSTCGGLCPSRVRLLLQRGILCSFGASIWALSFAYVRSFWDSFASLCDPHGLSRFILFSITWLITCKSAIKTRKSRKKRNWKNRFVNRKMKHNNPQE